MQDPAFMVIRVGKHREKIRVADYKPEKWPEGHEVLAGVPSIPAEIAAAAENTTAESVSDALGAPGAESDETPASEPESGDLDALKVRADELGIPYGANIGAPTLAKRIAEAEAYIDGEME
jgi:hypothetical protein